AQATTLTPLVKEIIKSYSENPGFGPEDLFLCNDPYVSVCHQTCVGVAGPIFDEGELVAWTGASLHAVDVGGPMAGQAQVDAED
ncbi:hydantoinase B/oxoprolinase family protein, partial [Escherichia coli]